MSDLCDYIDTSIPANTRICGNSKDGVSQGTQMRMMMGRYNGYEYQTLCTHRQTNTDYYHCNTGDRSNKTGNQYIMVYSALDDRVVLLWDHQKYKKTAYLVPEINNVGVIRMVYGTKKFECMCTNLAKQADADAMAMHTILDVVVHDSEVTHPMQDEHDNKPSVVSDDKDDGKSQEDTLEESQVALPH
jgi:hypothetical protein